MGASRVVSQFDKLNFHTCWIVAVAERICLQVVRPNTNRRRPKRAPNRMKFSILNPRNIPDMRGR